VLCELWVRVLTPQPTYTKSLHRYVINGESDFGIPFYKADDQFPFASMPQYRAQVIDNQEKQRFSVSLNDQGFRSKPFIPKQPDEVRLIVIGDSTVFGIGVEETDTVSSLLQDQLNARTGPGASTIYSVYNLGVGGYGPAEYYLLAKRYIPILKPDFVVVAWFTGNDRGNLLDSEIIFDEVGLPSKVKRRDMYVDEDHHWRTNSPEASVYRIPILRESHLAVYCFKQIGRFWRYVERGRMLPGEAPLPVSLDRLARGLQEIAAREGSKIVWVILPAQYDIDFNKDAEFLHAVQGLPGSTMVNLVPEFRRVSDNLNAYYADGSHFSRRGGEVIAHSISAAMERLR